MDGAGAMILTGSNSYTGGTNLNAGIVEFSALNNFGSSGALNFNGGAIRFAAGAGNLDISTQVVLTFTGAGGIDTNGNNITFNGAIGNNGAGGLNKLGSGTLTLNAANTYSGPTTVVAGTLAIGPNGTLGSEVRRDSPSAAALRLAHSI